MTHESLPTRLQAALADPDLARRWHAEGGSTTFRLLDHAALAGSHAPQFLPIVRRPGWQPVPPGKLPHGDADTFVIKQMLVDVRTGQPVDPEPMRAVAAAIDAQLGGWFCRQRYGSSSPSPVKLPRPAREMCDSVIGHGLVGAWEAMYGPPLPASIVKVQV